MRLRTAKEEWKQYIDPTLIASVILVDREGKHMIEHKLRTLDKVEPGVSTVELKLDFEIPTP